MWQILYGYYMMFMCGGRISWFYKVSLKVFDVSLFECKGSWKLKIEDYKTRLKKYHVQCC